MGAAVWVSSRLQAWFRSAFSWTEPEPKKPEDKSAKRFSILWHGKFHTTRDHCVKMVVMCGMRKWTGNIWRNNNPVTHNHLRCEWCHTFTLLGEYPGDKWLFITLRVCGNSCCWGKKSCKRKKKKGSAAMCLSLTSLRKHRVFVSTPHRPTSQHCRMLS